MEPRTNTYGPLVWSDLGDSPNAAEARASITARDKVHASSCQTSDCFSDSFLARLGSLGGGLKGNLEENPKLLPEPHKKTRNTAP